MTALEYVVHRERAEKLQNDIQQTTSTSVWTEDKAFAALRLAVGRGMNGRAREAGRKDRGVWKCRLFSKCIIRLVLSCTLWRSVMLARARRSKPRAMLCTAYRSMIVTPAKQATNSYRGSQ